MKRYLHEDSLPKRVLRAQPKGSVFILRCGHRLGLSALVIVLSCMIGCSSSKSGDGKTRWTTVESDNPNQKARP